MTDAPFHNCSFLLVDDVPVTRLSIQKMLTSQGNPTIYEAENGKQALDILATHSHSLSGLVIDFEMPVLHGLQVVKQIRTGSANMKRDLPIMMITGHNDKALFGLALSLDVNAFVLKPISRQSMTERLSRLIASPDTSSAWLKPVESYKWIDVDTAIRPILENKGVSSTESALDKINAAVERAQERFRAEDESAASVSSEDSYDQYLTKNMVSVHLHEIIPESILAKDLIGSKNQKLLSKKQKLSKNMLDRLRDIRSMGEPIEELWVVPPTK